jgi:hypothetical protein
MIFAFGSGAYPPTEIDQGRNLCRAKLVDDGQIVVADVILVDDACRDETIDVTDLGF